MVLESSNIPWQWIYRAYKYLLRGMENFPTAEKFVQELRSIGFEDICFERLTLDIVAIHMARKPASAA